MLASLQCSVTRVSHRPFSSKPSGQIRNCRICAQQSDYTLERPVRPTQSRRRWLARGPQRNSDAPKPSTHPQAQATDQYTILESFQEPHLNKGQKWRLQQWILRAVSSGAYSLSALLVAGTLDPATAAGEFNPGAGASVTASQPPSIPNPVQGSGLTPFEGLLIFAPVILYGLFSIYRSQVNPRAKLSDFLFIAAAAVVVANLFTIIVFRKRLY